MKIAVLPGDGIGPEIIAEAVKVWANLLKWKLLQLVALAMKPKVILCQKIH
jgi:isocitrate/isopropylmalate dehydrogenase